MQQDLRTLFRGQIWGTDDTDDKKRLYLILQTNITLEREDTRVLVCRLSSRQIHPLDIHIEAPVWGGGLWAHCTLIESVMRDNFFRWRNTDSIYHYIATISQNKMQDIDKNIICALLPVMYFPNLKSELEHEIGKRWETYEEKMGKEDNQKEQGLVAEELEKQEEEDEPVPCNPNMLDVGEVRISFGGKTFDLDDPEFIVDIRLAGCSEPLEEEEKDRYFSISYEQDIDDRGKYIYLLVITANGEYAINTSKKNPEYFYPKDIVLSRSDTSIMGKSIEFYLIAEPKKFGKRNIWTPQKKQEFVHFLHHNSIAAAMKEYSLTNSATVKSYYKQWTGEPLYN